MKKYITIFLFAFSQYCFGQYFGVNTSYPEATLDINGSLAIRVSKLIINEPITAKVDLLSDQKSIYLVLTDIAGPLTFLGLQGGSDGRLVVLMNQGNYDLIIENESLNTNSTLRIKTPNQKKLVIAPNGFVTLIYDSLYNRWRVIESESYQTKQWNINGNEGSFGDFLGTIDAKDLVFKTNNVEAARITTNGTTVIGTVPDLTTKLELNQTLNVKSHNLELVSSSNLPSGWQNQLTVSENAIDASQTAPNIDWPNTIYFNNGVRIGSTDKSITNNLEVFGPTHFADNIQLNDNLTVNTTAQITGKIHVSNASILDNTPVAEDPNLMSNFLPIAWGKIIMNSSGIIYSKTSNNLIHQGGGFHDRLNLKVPGYIVKSVVMGSQNNYNFNIHIPGSTKEVNLIKDINYNLSYSSPDEIYIVPQYLYIDPVTLNHKAVIGSALGTTRIYDFVIFGDKN